MDLTALKTALKRFGFDDTDPLTEWINAAIHEIEDEYDWPWLEVVASVNTAAGSNTITLPDDLKIIRRIYDAGNGREIQYKTRDNFFKDLTEQTAGGDAGWFTLTGQGTVQFYPVPDSVSALQLWYQASVAELVDADDVPEIPLPYHYLIVQGAAVLGLEAENEEERAQVQEQKYRARLEKMVSTYSYRTLGDPDTVRDSMGYGGAF